MLESLKGWKTFIFNSLVVFLGGLQASDFVTVVDAEYVPLALAIVGVINLGLRLVTDTPPAQK